MGTRTDLNGLPRTVLSGDSGELLSWSSSSSSASHGLVEEKSEPEKISTPFRRKVLIRGDGDGDLEDWSGLLFWCTSFVNIDRSDE